MAAIRTSSRVYRQVKQGLPVQRRPPARRPGRFTTCSALLSFSRSNLSTGSSGNYLVLGGSVVDIDELDPGDAEDVQDALGAQLDGLDGAWEWHTFRTDGDASTDPSDFIRLNVNETP